MLQITYQPDKFCLVDACIYPLKIFLSYENGIIIIIIIIFHGTLDLVLTEKGINFTSMFINFYPLNPNLNFLAVIRSNKEKMFKVLKSVIFILRFIIIFFHSHDPYV